LEGFCGSLEVLKGSLEFDFIVRDMEFSWVLGLEELVKVGPMESLFLDTEVVGVVTPPVGLFCLRRSWISLSILIEICLSWSDSYWRFLLILDSSWW
jgi:hypothetical protein